MPPSKTKKQNNRNKKNNSNNKNNISRSQSTSKKIRPYKSPSNLSNSSNSLIPEYKIRFDNSYSAVSMILKKGQKVFCNAGSMAWMDGKIEVNTRNRSGFFSGLKRMVLTDNSFFTTEYTGVSSEGNKITFAPKLPGDMVVLKIKPGTAIYLSGDGFCVASDNVKTAVKSRLRNIFVNEDVFMTKLYVEENSPSDGYVWASSYGGIIKKTIPVGQSLKVDNGHFLACDADVNYKLGKVGNWKSALLSGEGIVMTFEAKEKPITLYLQTRSFRQFIVSIAPYFQPKSS